jgi:pimeloyl-ACP methyl ester carboxylesterase
MDWWEDGFCERLRDGGRFVIRYDHRDTGQSTAYAPGKPEYSGDDLVRDAAAVIQGVGLDGAHVVGMSMGGALAQVLALDHPGRVRTLTLISTSPEGPSEDLPGATSRVANFFAVPRPDTNEREQLLDYLVAFNRVLASPNRAFDDKGTRALWERALDRARNPASMLTNHDLLDGGGPWRHRLPDLRIPTLVIHGRDDPFLPHEHGVALAREIPDARLLSLADTGHELPRPTWDEVVPAILGHTA